MVSYKPFWDMLKELNISTYALEKNYGLNKKLIYKLKHGENLNIITLHDICLKFNCNIENIVKIIPNDSNESPDMK